MHFFRVRIDYDSFWAERSGYDILEGWALRLLALMNIKIVQSNQQIVKMKFCPFVALFWPYAVLPFVTFLPVCRLTPRAFYPMSFDPMAFDPRSFEPKINLAAFLLNEKENSYSFKNVFGLIFFLYTTVFLNIKLFFYSKSRFNSLFSDSLLHKY